MRKFTETYKNLQWFNTIIGWLKVRPSTTLTTLLEPHVAGPPPPVWRKVPEGLDFLRQFVAACSEG
jgi:hypothetical protein